MTQPAPALRSVLLVGTYHMANPGADMFNVQADDVRTPRRQREVEAAVASLSAFGPTVVAVEWPYARRSEAADRYARYLAGDHELGQSEVEQLGFRAAQRAGLSTVHAVDVPYPFWDPAVEEVAARDPGNAERLEALQRLGAEDNAKTQRLLEAGTVTDVLAYLNSEDSIAIGLRPYVGLVAPIAQGDLYPGADAVADWYARNLRIFANLMRVTAPGDRVLVIFGAGHVPVLRHILEASGEAEVVPPETFLGGEADRRPW